MPPNGSFISPVTRTYPRHAKTDVNPRCSGTSLNEQILASHPQIWFALTRRISNWP
jgi:hypothetical protein